MPEQDNNVLPKKRRNPFSTEIEEPKEQTKKAAPKKTEATKKEPVKATSSAKKAPTKKTTTKKESTKPTTTTKKTSNKTVKKVTKPVVKITSTTKIDPKTGQLKETKKTTKPVKPVEKEVVPVKKSKTTPKKVVKKPSKELTVEPVVEPKPAVIVRPTPKKTHQWNKEEKVLYKQLEEAFNTIANMTTVIEERTMDTKNIPNLTIGELHLIEMVNRYNNKPMTLIANKLHITVGAMTICLNRLVQKGYLLRTRDEMDRRVILLSITPDGKKVLKFHNKFHDDIIGIALDTLPLAQATKVLTQFAYALEYYFDPSIATTEEKKTTKKGKSK